jgi:hypothetical protein
MAPLSNPAAARITFVTFVTFLTSSHLRKQVSVVTLALDFGNRSRSILCRNIAV